MRRWKEQEPKVTSFVSGWAIFNLSFSHSKSWYLASMVSDPGPKWGVGVQLIFS